MANSATYLNHVYVSLAHRYWNPSWDWELNSQVYGESCSEEGLGHNMRVEVAGAAEAREHVESALQRAKQVLDHQCLFGDASSWPLPLSTLEVMALHLGASVLLHPRLFWMGLWETDQLGAFYEKSQLGLDQPKLTLRTRIFNWTLDICDEVDSASGLSLSRQKILPAVRSLIQKLPVQEESNSAAAQNEWCLKVFDQLRVEIPQLVRLRVDFNAQEFMVVRSESDNKGVL